MKRDIRICKLRNWWLTQKYDNINKRYWILHGNKMPEGEFIESSAIKCICAFNKHQLVMESADTRYCCDIRYTLEEKFDWLYDSKVWLQELSKDEIQNYISSIQSLQRKRKIADVRNTALELDTDEYLLLGLSDGKASLYSCALYCKNAVQQYPEVRMEGNGINSTVCINAEKDNDCTELGYKTKGNNELNLFGEKLYDTPLYISNCGKNNLYVDTIFGRFCIPNNNRLYKISGNVLRGRIPVY